MSRDGYQPWNWPSPMIDRLGDLQAHAADITRFGFEVDQPKLNGRGRLHAGAMSTIADVVIGHALAARTSPSSRFVTTALEVHFLGAATTGDWIDVVVTPIKIGKRLAVGTAHFAHSERPIGFATATFMSAEPRSSDAR